MNIKIAFFITFRSQTGCGARFYIVTIKTKNKNERYFSDIFIHKKFNKNHHCITFIIFLFTDNN